MATHLLWQESAGFPKPENEKECFYWECFYFFRKSVSDKYIFCLFVLSDILIILRKDRGIKGRRRYVYAVHKRVCMPSVSLSSIDTEHLLQD